MLEYINKVLDFVPKVMNFFGLKFYRPLLVALFLATASTLFALALPVQYQASAEALHTAKADVKTCLKRNAGADVERQAVDCNVDVASALRLGNLLTPRVLAASTLLIIAAGCLVALRKLDETSPTVPTTERKAPSAGLKALLAAALLGGGGVAWWSGVVSWWLLVEPVAVLILALLLQRLAPEAAERMFNGAGRQRLKEISALGLLIVLGMAAALGLGLCAATAVGGYLAALQPAYTRQVLLGAPVAAAALVTVTVLVSFAKAVPEELSTLGL